MNHEPLPPFAATSGPHNARIVFVGEAFGESEDLLRKPFVGESGKELWRMLGEAWPSVAPELHAAASSQHQYGLAWVRPREAWLEAARVLFTNVLAFRPPGNKFEALCCSKKELPHDYQYGPVDRGLYLRPEYCGELVRLASEIARCRPNLVVLLGNKACWAVLGATNIGSIRGTVGRGASEFDSVKVLPTYHPASILRNWSNRPVVVADLMKALREGATPELIRPSRRIIIDPTLDEIAQWTSSILASPPPFLAVDTETEAGQIKCIGFAPSRSEALVIPFMDRERPGGSYWPSTYEEERAWRLVEDLLTSSIPKIWQNGLYDLQYCLRHGIRPRANIEDTMLLHHSIYPEMNKGLGFLGSIYSNEPAWKLMRKQKTDTEKRDE